MSAGAQVDAATLPEARQGRYWLDRESVLGPVLLLPAVIYIVALVGIPLVLAVLYSLSDVTIGDQSIDFVGLKNFREVLNSSTFRTALQNTFVFTIVSQAVVLVLANILALVLSADFKGKRLVRFLVLLPWTTPIALGVLGWLWTLDNVYSPIDYVMRQVGLLGVGSPLGPDWFGTNSLWLDYSDRARLSDMIVVFILTRGGPFDSTQVLASWAYFKGIEGGSLGQGAAIALFLFPVLVGVAALMLRIAKRAETV